MIQHFENTRFEMYPYKESRYNTRLQHFIVVSSWVPEYYCTCEHAQIEYYKENYEATFCQRVLGPSITRYNAWYNRNMFKRRFTTYAIA